MGTQKRKTTVNVADILGAIKTALDEAGIKFGVQRKWDEDDWFPMDYIRTDVLPAEPGWWVLFAVVSPTEKPSTAPYPQNIRGEKVLGWFHSACADEQLGREWSPGTASNWAGQGYPLLIGKDGEITTLYYDCHNALGCFHESEMPPEVVKWINTPRDAEEFRKRIFNTIKEKYGQTQATVGE